MIVFPNCKINLGLNILRKRSDGFHDLETVFYPLPFFDVLELIISHDRERREKDILFSTSGIIVDSPEENNLCVKAWLLLKKDFPSIPVIKMHLHKNIPAGAGLGGGSADGAFTLQLLNDTLDLGLSTDQLIAYALELGSDCPFFINNKPCFATGRGEITEPVQLHLSTYTFILVNPGIHIHTAHAFSQVTPALPARSVKEIIQQPLSTWKNELKNDFEEVVFRHHPAIKNIKDQLYKAGAVYASMSGSGSTVYGIFEKEKKVEVSFPESYFVMSSESGVRSSEPGQY